MPPTLTSRASAPELQWSDGLDVTRRYRRFPVRAGSEIDTSAGRTEQRQIGPYAVMPAGRTRQMSPPAR
jgi:hypothetical protein